jgi:hypothetical protein
MNKKGLSGVSWLWAVSCRVLIQLSVVAVGGSCLLLGVGCRCRLPAFNVSCHCRWVLLVPGLSGVGC